MALPAPLVDPLLACLCCSGRGAVEQYAPGLPFGFDDGLGATVEAPCTTCRGSGVRPCEVCCKSDATRIREGQPVCDSCATECDEADAAALAASEACWNGCGAAPVAMAAGRPLCPSCLDDVRRLSAASTIPAPACEVA